MPPANPWKSYRQITTLTAPPGQIILMLYEGAIRSLERASLGFTYKDPAEANMAIHNNLEHAQKIIHELDRSLNLELGGEFARTMRQLYNYFDRRIRESNLRKEPTGVQEVIRHLTELRDAWAAMLQKQSVTEAMPSAVLAAA
jgi:flagellar protein FliS